MELEVLSKFQQIEELIKKVKTKAEERRGGGSVRMELPPSRVRRGKIELRRRR